MDAIITAIPNWAWAFEIRALDACTFALPALLGLIFIILFVRDGFRKQR